MARTRTLAVLALCGLVFAGGDRGTASADLFKKAGKSIEKGANKAADKGKDAADKGKDAVDKGVDKGKDLVDDGVDKGKGALDQGKDLARDLVGSGNKELRELEKTAQKTYAGSVSSLEKAYKDAEAQAMKVLTAAQQAAYQAAAKAFFSENKEAIQEISARWIELMKDKGFAERVNRVLKQAAERKIDERSREDLQAITRELLGEYEEPEPASKTGLLELKPKLDVEQAVAEHAARTDPAYTPVGASSDGSGRPRKVKWLRSFTLTMTFTAGFGSTGLEAAVGMSVDLYRRNGRKYVDCKLIAEAGPLFGIAQGAQAGIAFGLWPTWTDDAPGAQFGLYGGVAKAQYGLQATVIWNFTDTWSVHASPGFTVAYAPGEGNELGIELGWTSDMGPSTWR
ncbi:MAG: antitoxin [Polyangia bacterium]